MIFKILGRLLITLKINFLDQISKLKSFMLKSYYNKVQNKLHNKISRNYLI